MIVLIKKYIEFGIGTVFGAIVATVMSFFIFNLAGGKMETAKLLQIEECLQEKAKERKEVINE